MPQPYIALTGCRDFGTLGPLASECISWSPGIRFGRTKESNSYATYIRSELKIYSFKLLLIYVTISSPACMSLLLSVWSPVWLLRCLPTSWLACSSRRRPHPLPASLSACSALDELSSQNINPGPASLRFRRSLGTPSPVVRPSSIPASSAYSLSSLFARPSASPGMSSVPTLGPSSSPNPPLIPLPVPTPRYLRQLCVVLRRTCRRSTRGAARYSLPPSPLIAAAPSASSSGCLRRLRLQSSLPLSLPLPPPPSPPSPPPPIASASDCRHLRLRSPPITSDLHRFCCRLRSSPPTHASASDRLYHLRGRRLHFRLCRRCLRLCSRLCLCRPCWLPPAPTHHPPSL